MPPKIDNYFTPKSLKIGVPKRVRSSPELNDNTKKLMMSAGNSSIFVGDVNFLKSELMDSIFQTMNNLLDVKLSTLATKDEIKILYEHNQLLMEENVIIKNEIKILKASHSRLERILDQIELKSRRNNLIFRGLKYEDTMDLLKLVTDFCHEVLDVEINADYLSVHPLGKRGLSNRPLMVSFVRFSDKLSVLRCVKRLKGTGFSVFNDLPENIRKKHIKLQLIRREVFKLKPQIKSLVRADRLYVGGDVFEWSESDGLRYGCEAGVVKLNELTGCDMSKFLSDALANSSPNNSNSALGATAAPASSLPLSSPSSA